MIISYIYLWLLTEHKWNKILYLYTKNMFYQKYLWLLELTSTKMSPIVHIIITDEFPSSIPDLIIEESHVQEIAYFGANKKQCSLFLYHIYL